jgi:NAD(P)-dependent dehydrogenase (short-subunit alcohol dehydrogenase family)
MSERSERTVGTARERSERTIGGADLCKDRVVIVTGAGRGLGREYALELARQGAKVVVNDLGGAPEGGGADEVPAMQVADEIRDLGGEAVANIDDVAEADGAQRLVDQAIETFGGLHAVVNNAGILRDRTLVNMSIDEWHSVLHVHLDSTYFMSHAAAGYWRKRSKAGEATDGRIVNTSSASGLFCNPGQSNYAAAKAGIAAFSVVAAQELDRYGVTVNAIAPGARTRLTDNLLPGPREGASFDAMDPAHVAPFIAWMCSAESASVTGQVFEVGGSRITLCSGWTRGPRADNGKARWDAVELGPVIHKLVADAPARERAAG